MEEKNEFEVDVCEAWKQLTGGGKAPRRYDCSTWIAVLERMKKIYGGGWGDEGGRGEGPMEEEDVEGEEEEEEEEEKEEAVVDAVNEEQPKAIKKCE